jgi:hypothetical protein
MKIKTHPNAGSSVASPKRPSRARRKPAAGYVLITVIAVAILVITCLSMLARHSLRLGLQAADEERMLQKRWGEMTLQKAMLVNAESIFNLREEQANLQTTGVALPPVIRSRITLGEVTFHVLLADEDAKLPLNTLYHHAGLKKTEDGISRIAGSNAQLATRLTPAVKPRQIGREKRRISNTDDAENENNEDIPDAFRSWGEVFDLATLTGTEDDQPVLQASTANLTCWGSGQLNFRRASDNAILTLASVVVQDGKARRILQRYRSNPTATLPILLQSEVTDQQEQRQLLSMFSETSTNFSIWIDAYSKTGASLRTFTVMKRDADGVSQKQRFSL